MLIYNATIVNEGRTFIGSVLTEKDKISKITEGKMSAEVAATYANAINAEGLLLLPGIIDDQVHFREPGLTHKADIYTESRAAVAGGVTSYMEMPNTKPQATTINLLENKFDIAAEKSIANYSFYLGATNENIDELKKADAQKICGLKVFMGSSTGNMLVDNRTTLSRIFSEIPMLIATHCEDEATIQANIALYKSKYGENADIKYHSLIRNTEACYKSSALAVELAQKYGARLHVLHISTEKEMSLFDAQPLKDKHITSEVCIHHLWFDDSDYAKYGNRIKWNPAIKTQTDKNALRNAVNSGKIDIVATDHAPHLLSEKQGSCFTAASGGPLVQHSLVAMLELAKQGIFTHQKVVEKMCHAPAELFRIDRRGYIREGYFADMVLVNPNAQWTVAKDNILYKCGWSPFEGQQFSHKVEQTFVNGNCVFRDNKILEGTNGMRLTFCN